MIRKHQLARKRGPIKRLHVDQAIIRQNRKRHVNHPALTIQTSAGPIKARRIQILGVSKLVQRANPLSCGARVFIETRSALLYG